MNLSNYIEAILFYKNEPLSLKEISVLVEKEESEVKEALYSLKKNLEGRGVALIEDGIHFSLATTSESSEIIGKITKDELKKEIGKAGLETLAIILYKGKAARREIDYIRGVNSNFILRALIVRGLIEKTENKVDRSFQYKPTLELLALLGLESTDKLPEREMIQEEIKKIEAMNDN